MAKSKLPPIFHIVISGLVVVITITVSLYTIRYFAPQLIGIPVDLRSVKVSKEVPPFYDNIFRDEDFKSQKFLIEDPVMIRSKPFYQNMLGVGPNDVIGFRNKSVPVTAQVITIGDSQTYGNNAPVELNWPNYMQRLLKPPSNTVYNMSCGAWAAIEYMEISKKALFFSPDVIIVAYYTGNDPIGSFIKVYGDEKYEHLRPNKSLKGTETGATEFDPAKANYVKAVFNDGSSTLFTPELRLSSNEPSKPADAGYEIMAKTAGIIAEMASKHGVKPVFCIIPTKEFVYAKKVKKDGLVISENYHKLVVEETKRIDWFSKKLAGIEGALYIDVANPLQNAALTVANLYLEDRNGHPLPVGYEIIANTIAPFVQKLVPQHTIPEGPVAVHISSKSPVAFFVSKGTLFMIKDRASVDYINKKFGAFKLVKLEDVARLPVGGIFTATESESK